MKKIVFILLFFTMSINAVEITGHVRRIYPSPNTTSARINFMLDEISTTKCHNTSMSFYYYFDIDNKALETDPDYFDKKFNAFVFYQILLQSAVANYYTYGPLFGLPVTIDIPDSVYPGSCGTAGIKINYVKTY